MKHYILLLLLICGFHGMSQEIKYLSPAIGNYISKYRYLVSDGKVGQDSLLIGEYKFNSLGFCVEEYQQDILSKTIYIYQNDSILLSSDQYINGSEYAVIQKKYFYDDDNLLVKVRQYIFNTNSNSTIFKYNKKRQLTSEIVKLENRTTQSKTKKYYSEDLLSHEEIVYMSDRTKKFHFYEYNKNRQLESFYHGIKKDEKILFKTYEYSTLGKLIKMSQYDCDKHTIAYEYDNLGNKIFERKFIDGRLVSITKIYYSNIAI
jgi:hypothetical protein